MVSRKKNIDIQTRRSRAMKLRQTGATLEAVATVISQEFKIANYNRSRAFEDIDECLKTLNAECSHATEEYRREQLERLDDWLSRLQPAIERGDTKAIGAAIQIIDRKCKLLGLDAPMQLMVRQQAESQIEAELRSFLASIQELLSPEAFREVMDAVVVIGERSTNGELN